MIFYKIFLKKEIMELWRTKKIIIIFVVSIILGFTAPLLTKLMPEILKNQSMDSVTIIVSEVDQYESWSQYFKNTNQLGVVAIIVIFSEILSKEIQTGTLVNIITKGVSRKSIICSIYSIVTLLWVAFLGVSTVICNIYTNYYWDSINLKDLLFAISMTGLFGLLLLSFLMLGQAAGKGFFGGLVSAGICYVASMIIGFIPKIKEYSPNYLTSGLQVIMDTADYNDFYKSIVTTSILIVLSFFIAMKRFDKVYL